MKRLLACSALALLALAPPVWGSGGKARVQTCTANLLNNTTRELSLKKASSRPAWSPGYRPQPARYLEPATLIYWWTPSGANGCWSHVVYHSGKRVVAITVEARKGHRRAVRCTQRGFHRCRVMRKNLRAPVVTIAVTLS